MTPYKSRFWLSTKIRTIADYSIQRGNRGRPTSMTSKLSKVQYHIIYIFYLYTFSSFHIQSDTIGINIIYIYIYILHTFHFSYTIPYNIIIVYTIILLNYIFIVHPRQKVTSFSNAHITLQRYSTKVNCTEGFTVYFVKNR